MYFKLIIALIGIQSALSVITTDDVHVVDSRNIDPDMERHILAKFMQLLDTVPLNTTTLTTELVKDLDTSKLGSGWIGQFIENNSQSDLFISLELELSAYIKIQYRTSFVALYKPAILPSKKRITSNLGKALAAEPHILFNTGVTGDRLSNLMNDIKYPIQQKFWDLGAGWTWDCFADKWTVNSEWNSCYAALALDMHQGTNANYEIIVGEIESWGSARYTKPPNATMIEMILGPLYVVAIYNPRCSQTEFPPC